ncbi:hypothetical protein GCK72_003094 [Caenorhabditis remanei]|uniref:Uncharacterized protein n=1 Tax=Caenorhabditis remanei TaxID=31234 RepID=A0A6A5HTJ5_CAERE|nr:hypothetical protein GCK72_003094 [Caenorhabditis remanei]KAF1771268.1 hypothetical protein GCK72_003094 [Caenorhabditis remanei]
MDNFEEYLGGLLEEIEGPPTPIQRQEMIDISNSLREIRSPTPLVKWIADMALFRLNRALPGAPGVD